MITTSFRTLTALFWRKRKISNPPTVIQSFKMLKLNLKNITETQLIEWRMSILCLLVCLTVRNSNDRLQILTLQFSLPSLDLASHRCWNLAKKFLCTLNFSLWSCFESVKSIFASDEVMQRVSMWDMRHVWMASYREIRFMLCYIIHEWLLAFLVSEIC